MIKAILRFFGVLAGLLFLLEVYVRLSTLSKGSAESPVMFIICGFGALIATIFIPYVKDNID